MNKKKQKFEDINESSNIYQEFWEFIKNNKKFWLIPILVILFLLGLLLILGSTAAAPFIYTLF